MVKKPVTFSIDSEIYEKFQNICDKESMSYSKKVQALIDSFIKGR